MFAVQFDDAVVLYEDFDAGTAFDFLGTTVIATWTDSLSLE